MKFTRRQKAIHRAAKLALEREKESPVWRISESSKAFWKKKLKKKVRYPGKIFKARILPNRGADGKLIHWSASRAAVQEKTPVAPSGSFSKFAPVALALGALVLLK